MRTVHRSIGEHLSERQAESTLPATSGASEATQWRRAEGGSEVEEREPDSKLSEPPGAIIAGECTVQVRMHALRHLSDHCLAQELRSLATQEHGIEVELLLYLSELDRRRLYREHACGSLFAFCVSRLGYSEDVAYKRVGVARMLRDYPLVVELLAEGRIHLSALMLLRPHLTQNNHRDWLLASAGKSKRDVEKLVAARCPKPDVATSVRRLSTAAPPTSCVTASSVAALPLQALTPFAPSATISSADCTKSRPMTRVQPLSAQSYRVIFTASEQLKQKMDRASELLSHSVAPSDFPALIERALDLLIERTERRRFGAKRRKPDNTAADAEDTNSDNRATSAPDRVVDKHAPVSSVYAPDRVVDKHAPVSSVHAPDPVEEGDALPAFAASAASVASQGALGTITSPQCHSRYTVAEVRRDVWERDAGRCTYADSEGNRCQERHFLQIDHRAAFGLGGSSTPINLRILCAAHNALHAEQDFGRDKIANAIEMSRAKRKHHRQVWRE